MINLVIDIGNTFTKIALFNNRQMIKAGIYKDFNQDTAEKFIEGFSVTNSIVSSVEDPSFDPDSFLGSFSKYRRFSTSVNAGIKNLYKTPQTLGLDRYAAVIGAAHLFKDQDVLIIDAGTCITYDLVDRQQNYYGGIISPGLKMRFDAMHQFTERLPLVEFDANFNQLFGNDTRTCMLAGVQRGILNEATGFIGEYLRSYPALKVVLCGGDAVFFDTQLKNSIFARIVETEMQLVLIGLNEVIYRIND